MMTPRLELNFEEETQGNSGPHRDPLLKEYLVRVLVTGLGR